MKHAIFQSRGAVTLVGGGQVGAGDLAEATALAPEIVAADSGAGHALQHGYRPAAVIGDLDSLPWAVRNALPAGSVHPITEQDSTDFDKALRSIAAPLVIGVGFDGDRLDHVLASFSVLVQSRHKCILLTRTQVVFHCPPAARLPLRRGSLVSLFPMGPVTGHSEGLEWPIAGLKFAPDGRVGTSNRATGPVSLRMDGPGMLCLLPRAALAEVARALTEVPAWPA